MPRVQTTGPRLLTQAQEVHPDDTDAVADFFVEADDYTGAALRAKPYTQESVRRVVEHEGHIEPLKMLLHDIQNVLSYALRERAIYPRHAARMNYWLNRYPMPERGWRFETAEGPLPQMSETRDGGPLMPLSEWRLVQTTPAETVFVKLLQELIEALQNSQRLAVCESCSLIFLADEHRPAARFCSNRCNSRVLMREHRARQKNSLQPVTSPGK